MKTKLFTHTDLDGVSCHIVANHFFGKNNVDVTYCDYKEVDKKVAEFFLSGDNVNYSRVFITDISVNKEVAEIIHKSRGYTQLIDHHGTAEWLNVYAWAHVAPTYEDGTKTSATDLFLKFLEDMGHKSLESLELHAYAEKVRRWDTWDWKNVYNEEYPKRLNNLLYLIGREKFIERFSSNIGIGVLEFLPSEEMVLSIEEASIEKYIESASKRVMEKDILGFKVGVVFAESYISELGNVLAENNPSLDFIAIINMAQGTVSYRGIHADRIDLGAFARIFGGGGHRPSAGSQFSQDLTSSFIDQVFHVEHEIITFEY